MFAVESLRVCRVGAGPETRISLVLPPGSVWHSGLAQAPEKEQRSEDRRKEGDDRVLQEHVTTSHDLHPPQQVCVHVFYSVLYN